MRKRSRDKKEGRRNGKESKKDSKVREQD